MRLIQLPASNYFFPLPNRIPSAFDLNIGIYLCTKTTRYLTQKLIRFRIIFDEFGNSPKPGQLFCAAL